MKEIKNFLNVRHNKVKRDYLKRMQNKKIHCMKVSKKYDFDYWDGDRKYGYGGYKYIKNYNSVLVKKLIKRYRLNNKSKILDIGCGKGFLAYDLQQKINSKFVFGTDISKYAKNNALKNFSEKIYIHDLKNKFKFKNKQFDLVICANVLHNLNLKNIFSAIKEITRISKKQFICVESFRNEKEQFNLQCWALTAKTLVDKKTWEWIYKKNKFKGDYEFIYFK
jgi:ubiquinone/menaquinone biosynthesis C-methylase UbiE